MTRPDEGSERKNLLVALGAVLSVAIMSGAAWRFGFHGFWVTLWVLGGVFDLVRGVAALRGRAWAIKPGTRRGWAVVLIVLGLMFLAAGVGSAIVGHP